MDLENRLGAALGERDVFQMKEQNKTPEKELSKVEIGNLPGKEFRFKVSEWAQSFLGTDGCWGCFSSEGFLACWDGPKRQSQCCPRLSVKKHPSVSHLPRNRSLRGLSFCFVLFCLFCFVLFVCFAF